MHLEDMNLEEVWQEIDRVANENKEIIQEVHATYNFDITDATNGLYSLSLADGVATVNHAEAEDAEATLTMNEKNFKKLLLGNLNATTAFMTGRLKVKGNIGYALKLEAMLKKLPFQS